MTPQWMTAERLAKLDELCRRDYHLCLKGHRNCREKSHYQWVTSRQEVVAVPVELGVLDKATGGIRRDVTVPGWKSEQVTVWEWESAYLHDATVEEVKASWKADDREQRALDWKREQQAILDGTFNYFNSRFDPIAKSVFMAQRPEFYLHATGMDGMHARPVAVVKGPEHRYLPVHRRGSGLRQVHQVPAQARPPSRKVGSRGYGDGGTALQRSCASLVE